MKNFFLAMLRIAARHPFLIAALVFVLMGNVPGVAVNLFLALYFKLDDIYELLIKSKTVSVALVKPASATNQLSEEHF